MKSSYVLPGLRGLSNLGNTCYMNVVIQFLSNTELFTTWLLHENIEEQESLTAKLCDLLKGMWLEHDGKIITPRSFHNKVGSIWEIFSYPFQHDSPELILQVLDQIHEEMKNSITLSDVLSSKQLDMLHYYDETLELTKRNDLDNILTTRLLDYESEFNNVNSYNYYYLRYCLWLRDHISTGYSLINDLFTGVYCNEFVCTECNKLKIKFETFTNIQIDVDDSRESRLEECLKYFSNTERLEESNQYHCDFCNKKVDAHIKINIWVPPRILMVQLKRFKHKVVINHLGDKEAILEKIESYIKYPLRDLSLNDNYHYYNKHDYTYSLYGVIHHRGQFEGGHYYGYYKHPVNDEWYGYDDETVYLINDNVEDEIVKNNGYILFYQRCD